MYVCMYVRTYVCMYVCMDTYKRNTICIGAYCLLHAGHIFCADVLDLSYTYHCNYRYDAIDFILIHVTALLLVATLRIILCL